MLTTPFHAAREFTEKYHLFITHLLERKGVSPDSIEAILEEMETDSGLYLSRNPRYQISQTSTRQFFEQHRLLSSFSELKDTLIRTVPYLYKHQEQAIESILAGQHTVIATGTGSGKTEAFLIPLIADSARQEQSGIRALIIYPMNALANDQMSRLERYCKSVNVEYGLYTGETDKEQRQRLRRQPPQILITNYVMLERMVMREEDRNMLKQGGALRYIVFDELHSYSGSRAAHLKYLLARLRDLLGNSDQVLIGTSATLTQDSNGKTRLDDFLKHLWQIQPDNYLLIRGEEQLFSMTGDPLPMPDFSNGTIPSVDRIVDPYDARFFEQMLGIELERRGPARGSPEDDAVYLAARRNPFLAALRKRLEAGAVSAGELVALVEAVTPSENLPSVQQREILVSAYLQLVEIVNQRFADDERQSKPLLDYRLHLFMRHLVGYLKRCPACGRYYSGDRDFCPRDGYSLYPVYRDDVRQMIAKVRLGGELSGWIDREGDEKPLFTYVRMLRAVEVSLSDGEFTLMGDINPAGRFSSGAGGQIALASMSITEPDELHLHLINLCDESTNFEQIHHLVGSLLAPYKPRDKRSLGFVDQRERASQLSAALRDDFTSVYLRVFAAFHWQDWEGSAQKALERLQRKANARSEKLPQSALERAILAETDLWFWRELSRTADDASRFQVSLYKEALPDDLTSIERALLSVFVRERRFYRDDTLYEMMQRKAERAQYIRFELWRVDQHLGIAFESGKLSRRFSALVLSEQSVKLADIVDQYPIHALHEAMKSLYSRGLLQLRTIRLNEGEGSVEHYYLSLDLIQITLDEIPPRDEDAIGTEYLLTARAHTAELDTDQRREVEMLFRGADEQQPIHFVVATPTLEMGIDIGELQSVVMFGAPPSPANYAQRAGRAGRSRRHPGYYDALISTLCFASSDHDMRAYDDPRKMIDGVISPPGFNPYSKTILHRHVNAVVLRPALADVETLRAYLQRGDYLRGGERLRRIFGVENDYTAYLASDDFAPAILKLLDDEPLGNKSLLEYLYRRAVLPEYGFARETVKAMLSSSEIASSEDEESPFAMNRREVAERSLEQAFRLFVPGQTAYLSDDIFYVTAHGKYDQLLHFSNARQYREIEVRREQWFAHKLKFRNRYRVESLIAPTNIEPQDWGGIVRVGFTPTCYLAQLNYGGSTVKNTLGTAEVQDAFPFGYQIERPALVLRFDSAVCDERSTSSLVAALFQTIVESYGLGRSEIIINLESKEPNDQAGRYAVLYDADGNRNIPFRKMPSDFRLLVEKARERLATCDCTDGCERCLHSFETQRYAGQLSRQVALQFCDYLLGRGPFTPAILPFKGNNPKADLEMHVRQQKDGYCIEIAALRRCVPVEQLYAEMAQIVSEYYRQGMKVLRVSSRIDWVVNAINKREVDKHGEAFTQLIYQLLRFETVMAVKE